MNTQQNSLDNLDWLSLADDEEVIWSDTPHQRLLIRDMIPGILLAVFIIGIPLMIAAYLRHKNTHYVISTDALYLKTGILSRNVRRIDLAKVQDSSYRQSFFGTIFGYGSLDVSTAGGSGVELSFRGVSDPKELQSMVNDLIRDNESANSHSVQPSPRGIESGSAQNEQLLQAILQELEAIHSTLDENSQPTGANQRSQKSLPSDAPRQQQPRIESEQQEQPQPVRE